MSVNLRNFFRKPFDVIDRQFSGSQHSVKLPPLRETSHFDCVVDFRLPVQFRTVRFSAYPDDFEVKLRGEALVQAQFLLAKILTFFRSGKIEKAEIDRFFQLVSKISGQEDPGDMGFDQFDLSHRMVIK